VIYLLVLALLWTVPADAQPLTREERATLRLALPLIEKLAADPVIHVTPPMSLQAALDASQPGDVLELAEDVTFAGSFVLPKRAAPGVTLRGCAEIRSLSSEAAIRTAPNGDWWSLQGLSAECKLTVSSANPAGEVIRFGSGSQTAEQVPANLSIKWLHVKGDPLNGQKRGLSLHSGYTEIRESLFTDFKLVGQDAQAIAGWNGPGPYTIVGNHLEAAGETILFGGADPSIPGLVPSYIVIEDNTFTRPLSWRSEKWTIKNHLELKNAQHVTIHRNRFSHHWATADGPNGYTIWLTPANQGGMAPWSTVRDVTLTYNTFRDVSAGISMAPTSGPHPAVPLSDVKVRDNTFALSKALYGGSGRALVLLGIPDVAFEFNAVTNDGENTIYLAERDSPNFSLVGNILPDNAWGILSSKYGEGERAIPQMPGGVYAKNLILSAEWWLYDHGGLNRVEVVLPAGIAGYGPR
jgi:hypothetical protein